MLEVGQQVATPDGAGRLVSVSKWSEAGARIHGDVQEVMVRPVLLEGGEVRWYTDTALQPLTWGPRRRADDVDESALSQAAIADSSRLG